MNLEVKDIPSKIAPLLGKLRRYTVLLFVISVLILVSFLVLRINILTQTEPDDAAVLEQLQTVQRPQIDQDAIDRMQRLESQNIEVRSLFEEARRNPFSE